MVVDEVGWLQLMLDRETDDGDGRSAARRAPIPVRARECSEMDGRVRSELSCGLFGGLFGLAPSG